MVDRLNFSEVLFVWRPRMLQAVVLALVVDRPRSSFIYSRVAADRVSIEAFRCRVVLSLGSDREFQGRGLSCRVRVCSVVPALRGSE